MTQRQAKQYPELMTAEVACNLLGIHGFKLNRLAKQGTIRTFKPPGNKRKKLFYAEDVRLYKEELDEFRKYPIIDK